MSLLSSIHNPARPNLLKATCITLAVLTAYSSSAYGFNAAFKTTLEQTRQQIENMQRRPLGPYTEKPTKIFYGSRPSRDPIGRGGWWTPNLLNDLRKAKELEARQAPLALNDLYLSTHPVSIPSPPPEGGGGGENPGEGGGSGGGSGTSQLNTNTGNRHGSYPIVSWSARGDAGVNFTLHHNSFGYYTFDLGKGWSHGYDVKIAHTPNSSAIVRYGDGSTHPYTDSFGTFTPPAGIHDQLVHNVNGTWTITSKDRSKLEFNSAGRLTAVKDKNNNTITINRDANQKIYSITDGTGRSLTFAYVNGLISTVTDPMNRQWEFNYNADNHLTGITYPELNNQLHTRTFTYNALCDILTETDLRGKVWSFAYDSTERLTAFTNPLNHVWTWNYSTTAATMTQPNGKTVVHNYSAGLIASKVDQAGFSESYTYDSARNLVSYRDKRNFVWTGTYTAKGNILSSVDPLQNTTSFSYNNSNDVTSIIKPLSDILTLQYASSGLVSKVTNALGHTVAEISRDVYGDIILLNDALGRNIGLTIDNYGDIVSTIDTSGVSKNTTYDLLGRAISHIDASGSVTSLTYDSWGRLTKVTEPSGGSSRIGYDLEGNLDYIQDPLGNETHCSFDSAGNVISILYANEGHVHYEYDSNGNQITFTNARGFARYMTYTDRGELASLQLPDGSLESWAYDANGNISGYTNAMNETVLYSYDTNRNKTLIDYPAGQQDVTFSYDSNGRPIQMHDSTGFSKYTYNANGDPLTYESPFSTLTYSYNTAGQIVEYVDSSTGSTTINYDFAGRPSTLIDPFGKSHEYFYDSSGRVGFFKNGNDTVEEYNYDNLNRLVQIKTKSSANTTLKTRSYTYDLGSRITSTTDEQLSTYYQYDSLHQLIQETKSSGYIASYDYDLNGNRISRTVNGVAESYDYDNADKLLSVSGGHNPRTFQYDFAGRTTAIVGSQSSTTFNYDFESRLISTLSEGSSNEFSYNGLGALMRVDSSTGPPILIHRNGVGATSAIVREGDAVFTPSGERKLGVTSTFHSGVKHFDTITDELQQATATRDYDAFGKVISATGTWQFSRGFGDGSAYLNQMASNYCHVGNRIYDQDTGRFLTRDISKAGNNWYTYCDNNPVTRWDPTGNDWEESRPWVQGILDIIGVFDPTGVVDIANGVVHLFHGEWLFAILTVLGILPVIGDLAKLGKYAAKLEKLGVKFGKTGAKSFDEFHKHLSKMKKALDRIKELTEEMARTTSKSVKQRIQKEIDQLSKSVGGHLKEMDQKWPGWQDALEKLGEFISGKKGRK